MMMDLKVRIEMIGGLNVAHCALFGRSLSRPE